MVVEALNEARHIERHELMDDGLRQPLLGHIRGAYRPGGAEHGEILAADTLDQRDDRQKLPDARAVNPDQRARRPRYAALAVALGKPHRMLAAALETMREQAWRKR